MKLINLALAFCALFTTALSAHVKNSSVEYYLQTKLKPGQPGKERFNGLWLEAYHTGAGLNDAVVSKNNKYAAKGFLNGTNGEEDGVTYQNQVFDLGSTFPYVMIMEPNDVFYTSWQPVVINAGDGPSNHNRYNGGFFIGTTDGLKWTSDTKLKPNAKDNEFGGWLICDWWHQNTPQLFFRLYNYDSAIPCSCADVWLCPKYI